MSENAKITTLIENGTIVYPKTVKEAVYGLEEELNKKEVTIGSTPDEDAVLWIEPDGDVITPIYAPNIAQVGQTIVVSAVDENGRPTAWEAVDMPQGGDEEQWELINEITIADDAPEANAIHINKDLNNLPFNLKKALLLTYFPIYTGSSTIPPYSFCSVNNKQAGTNAPLAYTSFVVPNNAQPRTCSYLVEIAQNGKPYHEIFGRIHVGGSKRSIGYYSGGSGQIADYYCNDGTEPAPDGITEIGATNNLIFPGCYFALYGVRK